MPHNSRPHEGGRALGLTRLLSSQSKTTRLSLSSGVDRTALSAGLRRISCLNILADAALPVESTFDQPCTPKPGGFDSGVKTVPDNLDVDAPGLPTVTLVVKDSQPIWLFDQAGGTCNQGGVFAVNPTGSQTPGAFKDNAMKAIMAPVNASLNASGGSPSSATPTSSSSIQGTQRASKTNAGAAIAASQVALSSLAAIMLGVAMGML
ncbi:hypothetical protein AAF712_007534 [Marasmius tenuissimus]|uniref:Uncharacterized protein n=1 Tax=Marasmius tenuissimus TaxID=585030 RepID=A0ABR2ZVX6_9AGAR